MSSVRYIPAISTDAGAVPVSTEVATHPRAGDGFEVQDVFLQQLADLIEARTQTPTIANAINVQIGPGDPISNIPVVMDFGQHQVHEGEAHGWEYYTATVPATRNFALVVPDYTYTIGAPHLLFQLQSYGGAGMLSIYEGATYTGGTPVTPFNRNRNSTTAPRMVIVDGVTSANGVKLPYTAIAGAAEKTADGVRANDEIVLKANTTYVIRYEEITATTRVIIHFEWYEDLGQ